MDRTLEDTFYIAFTTRSFSTGAPATLSGTPVVSAYEDAGLTQITAGITLGVDHDSVTGLNMLTIVAAAASGYEAGKDYNLVITTGTVGGVSVVGEVVGTFSLGLDASYKRLGAPAGASVSADLADVPTVAEFNARTLVAADYFDPATDTVATVTNLTNLPTIPANWLTAAGIAASALDGKGNWNIGKTGYTLTQTFPANFSDFAITVTTGKVTAENVTLAAATHTGAVIPTVSTLTGHTPQTADHAANISAILTDTGTTLEAHLTDIKGATWATTDSLEAIRDRGDAAWTTGAGGTPPQLLQNTTIATLASQTSFTLTAGSADNDAYNGAVVVVTDSATSTQKAVGSVSDYVGSTKTITLSADPAIFVMAVGDTIDIIANASTAPSAAAVRAEIDSNSTQLAAIVADTNELQTDWANAGRLDAILDSRMAEASINTTAGAVDVVTLVTTTTTNTDMRGTDSAALASVATEARLSELDAVTVGKMANQVDIIQTDTTTDIPASIAALNNVAATDIVSAGAITTLAGAVVNVDLVDTTTTNTDMLTAAAVNAEVDTALADYDGPTNAEMEARTPTAAQLAYIVANAATGMPVVFTTAGGSTTVAVLNTVDGSAASATDDQYNGRLLVFTDGTLKGVVTDITDYVGSTTTATITAIPTAPTSSHNARLI